MKYFVLIAALLLVGTQAQAQPASHSARERASNHDRNERDRDRDYDRDRDRNRDYDRDRDRDHSRVAVRPRAFYRPPIGHIERRLPDRHVIVRVRRHPYYYFGGTFYDRWDGSYIIVNAPIGARIATLPTGFISFGIGPTRYFYFGGTYYIYNRDAYEVVEPPPHAQQIVNAAQQEMIIYPAKGQSPEQTDKDRYECHRWAVGQTGFDPSANNPDLSMKPDYTRAMGACLEARGYVVK